MRALLVLTLLAGAADADPLASLREDVDGDGAPDRIEVAEDGVVHVGTARIKIAPALAKARLAVASQPRGTRIVVDATARTGREAIVLERRGAGWRVAKRFALGGVGLDREYGFEVDATDAGIVRYQTRWDVRRCDGKPAYLFAERLDGTTFKRLDRLPSQVPAGAPQLAARLDPDPAPAPVIYQARGASHQAGAPHAGALAIPRELDDGRADTAWREDLASRGEGQFFTFKSRVDAARAHQLRIVPGDPSSGSAMRATSRPRAMAIVTRDGAWRFELPDAAGERLGAAYVVDLPRPLGDCVTVILESVYGRGPTAIAELELFAADERSGGGAALLARVVAEGKANGNAAAAALARLGAAGARAIDDELARSSDPAARRRLVGALVKIRDPAALASLVRAASEGWVRDRDLIDVIGALAAGGQVAPLRQLAGKTSLPLAVRIAAVQHIPASQLAVLAELAGRGSHDLRRAVIRQLATAPAAGLVQAATQNADPAAAGDLWRAVTLRVRDEPASRPAAVAAMLAELARVTDYERRYRLIDGVATHGDPAALAQLEAVLRGLPAGSVSAALRQVAIRGIASAPRKAAAPIVIAYARDPDPGVRLAALTAIANAESDAAGAWHSPDGPGALDRVLITAMADTWPEVRRRAAAALGTRCQRAGPARVLFEAVALDKDLDVRSDALVALVQCRATGVAELLSRTWDSGKQPLRLRTHAVTLVVQLGDKRLARTLVGKLRSWRGQALESREAMELAVSACATIGRMAPPGAAAALMAALDDIAFPEIVSAAALGLGALGPACPAAAKRKLLERARSADNAQVKLAAKRAAAQCGR